MLVGEIMDNVKDTFWKRLLKSDLQTNNPLYMLISIYLGIVLFVLNVALINVFSLSDIAEKWKNNCSEKISIEIPEYIATPENILKIKNFILEVDDDAKINTVEKEQMLATMQKYMKSDEFSDMPFPVIIEVQNFDRKLEIANLQAHLNEISENIKIHDHSKILNPAIKISNFVESSYYVITILLIVSLILYVFVYCYQNILINKQNIYILTMLCAEKEYIFKQMRTHLFLYFLVSFGISVVFSGAFLAYLFIEHIEVLPSVMTNIVIILMMPLFVFTILLGASRYATYFVIKRQSFDCF